jgi:pyrimidine-nucleoside phosphorylase
MYALRDVTGTVESQSLICASIMSKKLAEGIDALVLDVKTGSGAFMKRQEDAELLAQMMVDTGERMGKKMAALITDMDQPLGRCVGNSLEVLECIEILHGDRKPMSEDLRSLSLGLAASMFYLAGRTATAQDGIKLAEEMIMNGEALNRFREMIRLQRGDADVIDDTSRLPAAKNKTDFNASSSGYIQSVHCEQVGIASLVLGGGRNTKEDVIDFAVGLELHKKVGDKVESGERIATVHYNSDAKLSESLKLLKEAYHIGSNSVSTPRKLIKKIIGA